MTGCNKSGTVGTWREGQPSSSLRSAARAVISSCESARCVDGVVWVRGPWPVDMRSSDPTLLLGKLYRWWWPEYTDKRYYPLDIIMFVRVWDLLQALSREVLKTLSDERAKRATSFYLGMRKQILVCERVTAILSKRVDRFWWNFATDW